MKMSDPGTIPEKIMKSEGDAGKSRIRESTGKVIRVSTGKGRIRASIKEGRIQVSTRKSRIQASTGNVGSGRVLEMWDLGEY